MKKYIYLLIGLVIILSIFAFSSKDSNKSNSTSKELIYKTTIIYEKVTNKDIDNEKVVTKLNYPVRKLAHFTLYFLLGLFLYKFMLLTGINKKELIVIIICLLYAIMDEVHQMFVGGRTSQLLDVFIDSLGFLTSIYLVRRLEKK